MCTKSSTHRFYIGAIPFAELGKLISQNWKALSDEDRAKYDALAAEDKVRYQREVEKNQAAMAAAEQQKQKFPGPKIRNKRLADGLMSAPDGRRMRPNPYQEYEGAPEYPSGPSPRGPPPYYDPYFGYGRPPMPGGEGYGPPPGAFNVVVSFISFAKKFFLLSCSLCIIKSILNSIIDRLWWSSTAPRALRLPLPPTST